MRSARPATSWGMASPRTTSPSAARSSPIAVNPLASTRAAWRAVGERAAVAIVEVEVICSDVAEHRRRVASRSADIPGLKLPTWDEMQARAYRAVDGEHLVIDTAQQAGGAGRHRAARVPAGPRARAFAERPPTRHASRSDTGNALGVVLRGWCNRCGLSIMSLQWVSLWTNWEGDHGSWERENGKSERHACGQDDECRVSGEQGPVGCGPRCTWGE